MTKIPIVMPLYNRPHYLQQVLQALSRCANLDKFTIVTCEENAYFGQSTTVKENTRLLKSVKGIHIKRHINAGITGCAGNIIQAIDRVARNHAHFVVLEDDVVPARDFLTLMLFGFKNADDTTVLVQGYAKNEKAVFQDSQFHDKVERFPFFSPWGWGTSATLWKRYRQDFRRPLRPEGSWAIPLGIWLLKKNLLCYRPVVGRTQNIGEYGTFMKDLEIHRAVVHNEYWYGAENPPFDHFVLVDKSAYLPAGRAGEYVGVTGERLQEYRGGIVDAHDYRPCFADWESL